MWYSFLVNLTAVVAITLTILSDSVQFRHTNMIASLQGIPGLYRGLDILCRR